MLSSIAIRLSVKLKLKYCIEVKTIFNEYEEQTRFYMNKTVTNSKIK